MNAFASIRDGIRSIEPKRPERFSHHHSISTLNEFMISYFNEIAPKNEWTRSIRSTVQTHVLRNYGHLPMSRIDAEFVRRVLDCIFINSPGTARTILKALKPAFSYAEIHGLVPQNPIRGFKLAPPNPTPLICTVNDLARVITAAKVADEKWWTVIALSLATLVPIQHVRVMRSQDIDWTDRLWKTSAPTTSLSLRGNIQIPLSGYALSLLRTLDNAPGYLFSSPKQRHSKQHGSTEVRLPLTWPSSLTATLRRQLGFPGNWTMKDIRRNAISLSGLRNVKNGGCSVCTAEAALFESWGRRLSAAVGHNESPTPSRPMPCSATQDADARTI